MKEIFFYFLHLGIVGFGGPLALIAQMQRDLVENRKWISRQEFAQTFALIKSMPGPVAFQTAVFLGNKKAGFWGATVAGIAMILPSFFMMVLLAAFYGSFVEIPWVRTLMIGMQMGALALIISGLISLTQDFYKAKLFWLLFLSGLLVLFLYRIPEPLFILGGGFLALSLRRQNPFKKFWAVGVGGVGSLGLGAGLPTGIFSSSPQVLMDIFVICFKAGAVVFGTGLAIIPLLETDFVIKQQWLNHQEFLDALAFGQMTPGPVVITVTFIGYKVAGMLGAVIATVGILAPAFIHMTTWFPRAVKWLGKQKWILTFTTGVTAAVAATIILSLTSITTGWSPKLWLGAAVLFAIIWRYKIPGWLLIFGGGILAFII